MFVFNLKVTLFDYFLHTFILKSFTNSIQHYILPQSHFVHFGVEPKIKLNINIVDYFLWLYYSKVFTNKRNYTTKSLDFYLIISECGNKIL